jgi:flavin reductase (DIM6/NTAB) family NADH-FMN oxidoreductase RutF
MGDEHFYEMKCGHGLSHDPFKAIIAPRPIGWISTQSLDGHTNLAPYSFFNALGENPHILGFSSTGYKDSVKNIEQTKEFVFNLATRLLAEKMSITSYAAPYGINEMRLAGLEALPSRLVNVPRVRDS